VLPVLGGQPKMTGKREITEPDENRNTERPKRKVQRHSPHRLLRQKLVLPGDITVSAEKHKGRLVVRVESPE
jgi:hypothetical protein